MITLGAVVLAAGEGRRFRAAGGDIKVLAEVEGRSLLAIAVSAVSAIEHRVVVLGSQADVLARDVVLAGEHAVVNEHWKRGMASSLAVGLASLPGDVDAAVVVLADAPRLSAEAVRRVGGAAVPDGLVSAAYGGIRGHPVAIGRALWASLPVVGEAAGRTVEPVLLVECGDLGEPGDADTPRLLCLTPHSERENTTRSSPGPS